ncbi:MAG TPA: PQQ-binding-like beta-propeller repeat protein [Tepidisphaeraceae bacterium]|nr:PQQ-binding-like beta-propeller repeat protein [Tepidisphaeraceae bacterium]
MNRRLPGCTLIGVLPLFLLIAGCNQSPPPAAAAPVEPASTVSVDPNDFLPIWRNSLPLDKGDSISRVYVMQDLVLAVSENNVVYVINKSDGVVRFINYVDGGGRAIGKPLVLADRIIYPAQTTLQVYNRRTGDFIRSVDLGFTISSGIVSEDDQLYMGADLGGGELANVDLSRTYVPVRWKLLVFGEVSGAPALYDNIIYVGSGDGGVRAVTPDRTAMWPLEHDAFFTGGPIVGDIQVDDAGVYAASASGRLVCLDRNTGQIAPSIDPRTDKLNTGGWQYFAPNPLRTGPVVTPTMVYQQVPDVGMVAIDKVKLIPVDPDGRHRISEINRTPQWISPDAAQFVSENRRFTFVGSADQELLALDKGNGAIRYRSDGTHFAAMASNLTDSLIYASAADGTIVALRPVLQPGSPGYIQ